MAVTLARPGGGYFAAQGLRCRAVRRRLRPFGITFDLIGDDGRVFDAAAAALARFPRDAGAEGHLQLEVRTGCDGPDDPAWPITAVRLSPDRRSLTLRCGSARLDADIAAGRACAVVPPSLLALPDALRMIVEGAFSALAINAGLLHAVHAGLVRHRGRGLLLRGPSGAGKSTLTYALLAAGCHVVSDDWTYAVAGGAPGRLWGYPWRLFLVDEALPYFPELAGAPRVPHPGADRIKLAIEPPPARRRRGAALDAVVFLDPAPELDVRRVDAQEAQRRFWDPALPTERDGLPADWVEALLARPTYVLQRGRDPHAAAAALQELADSLR